MGEVSLNKATSDKAIIRSEQFNTASQGLSGPHHLHSLGEVGEDGFDQDHHLFIKGAALPPGKILS